MNLTTRIAALESKVHERDSRAQIPDGLGHFGLLCDTIDALEAAFPGQVIDASAQQLLDRLSAGTLSAIDREVLANLPFEPAAYRSTLESVLDWCAMYPSDGTEAALMGTTSHEPHAAAKGRH